jgi:hypothetical protein
MFSVVKVREGISAGDYTDPGWYQNPPGTQAWEWAESTPAVLKEEDVPSRKATGSTKTR